MGGVISGGCSRSDKANENVIFLGSPWQTNFGLKWPDPAHFVPSSYDVRQYVPCVRATISFLYERSA